MTQKKHLHIILPTQLFYPPEKHHPIDAVIVMIEEEQLFTKLPFHKTKLVYHRATMKHYFNDLPHTTKSYRDFRSNHTLTVLLQGYDKITMCEPHDIPIKQKWEKLCGSRLHILPSPMFLLEHTDVPPSVKRHHDSFYRFIRHKTSILMNNDGDPVGGKFTFDTDNRQRCLLPSSSFVIPRAQTSDELKEAIEYVDKHFSNNPGSVSEEFIYPIDRKAALLWLRLFCKERLSDFGKYQDSLSPHESLFVYHSGLSPCLNIGLLIDKEVVQEIMKHQHRIPIQSLEGCIRQIIGWRQYVMTVYHTHGDKIRRMNFFNNNNKIPLAFWEGRTGIPPVDNILKKVHRWAYCHHIERLMVLGNFLLMCRCHPTAVAEWFQSFVSIDAYDLFMLTNVNCMSQFGDGGMYMMKRPYLCSSAYILKMSMYKPKDASFGSVQWTEIWDSLYYLFVSDHSEKFRRNYAMAAHVSRWTKFPKEKQDKIKRRAKDYLKWLHNSN